MAYINNTYSLAPNSYKDKLLTNDIISYKSFFSTQSSLYSEITF